MKKHRKAGKIGKGRARKIRKVRPPKVTFGFTDLDITAFGGSSILSRTAHEFGLFDLLDGAVSVKVRNRGASDLETLWSIIACLARGHGSLSDLDGLRSDRAASLLLGLRWVPESRRAGEWLSRLDVTDIRGLWNAAVAFAGRVAPSIIAHEVETKGYVPLFMDATGIEVDGHLFERTGKDYNGNRGYWLHGTFVGGLWSAGQLQPGGGRVTLNWRKLLHWTAGMLPKDAPVWFRADNAYYKGDLVRECAKRGWDYSISLTNDRWRRPVLAQLEGLLRFGMDGYGHGRRSDSCDALAGWMGADATLCSGSMPDPERPVSVSAALHGHSGVSERSAPEGVGASSPGQAGSGERFQGSACGHGPASPTVPELPGEPGLLRPGSDCSGSAAGGTVHGTSEESSPSWHPPDHPLCDANGGVSGSQGSPTVCALCQEQLPAGLAVPVHGHAGSRDSWSFPGTARPGGLNLLGIDERCPIAGVHTPASWNPAFPTANMHGSERTLYRAPIRLTTRIPVHPSYSPIHPAEIPPQNTYQGIEGTVSTTPIRQIISC